MVSQADTAERSHIRVVAKQGGYPSGWSLIRVVIIHQHDRSLECSFIGVSTILTTCSRVASRDVGAAVSG